MSIPPTVSSVPGLHDPNNDYPCSRYNHALNLPSYTNEVEGSPCRPVNESNQYLQHGLERPIYTRQPALDTYPSRPTTPNVLLPYFMRGATVANQSLRQLTPDVHSSFAPTLSASPSYHYSFSPVQVPRPMSIIDAPVTNVSIPVTASFHSYQSMVACPVSTSTPLFGATYALMKWPVMRFAILSSVFPREAGNVESAGESFVGRVLQRRTSRLLTWVNAFLVKAPVGRWAVPNILLPREVCRGMFIRVEAHVLSVANLYRAKTCVGIFVGYTIFRS